MTEKKGGQVPELVAGAQVEESNQEGEGPEIERQLEAQEIGQGIGQVEQAPLEVGGQEFFEVGSGRPWLDPLLLVQEISRADQEDRHRQATIEALAYEMSHRVWK